MLVLHRASDSMSGLREGLTSKNIPKSNTRWDGSINVLRWGMAFTSAAGLKSKVCCQWCCIYMQLALTIHDYALITSMQKECF